METIVDNGEAVVGDTGLVLVTGLDRDATGWVAERFGAEPGSVVVHHDLRAMAEGVVRRRVRADGADTTTILELGHGCVSCTLREDALPLLHRLAADPDVRRIVLHLDPGVAPEPVCWALHNVLLGDVTIAEITSIEAVVAVADEGEWLAAVTGDEPLGLTPDDDRTLAEVAVGQVEYADAVVLTGQAADGWTTVRTAAVLDRLAPTAPRTTATPGRHESAALEVMSGRPERTAAEATSGRRESAGSRANSMTGLLDAIPADARRGVPGDAHGPLLRGCPPLEPDCGVALTVFEARRPFHPARLHRAIDVLLSGVVRARGRFWVATQPDVALWLESAGGGLRVGHAGAWLAAVDDDAWNRASADRRAKAAVEWHPRWGDRMQEFTILSHEASPGHLVSTLREALLTDDELASDWHHYEDPFTTRRPVEDKA